MERECEFKIEASAIFIDNSDSAESSSTSNDELKIIFNFSNVDRTWSWILHQGSTTRRLTGIVSLSKVDVVPPILVTTGDSSKWRSDIGEAVREGISGNLLFQHENEIEKFLDLVHEVLEAVAPPGRCSVLSLECEILHEIQNVHDLGRGGDRHGGMVGDDETCSICLEGLMSHDDDVDGALSKLPCLHVFHGGCVMEWLRRSLCCPLCRSEIRERHYSINSC